MLFINPRTMFHITFFLLYLIIFHIYIFTCNYTNTPKSTVVTVKYNFDEFFPDRGIATAWTTAVSHQTGGYLKQCSFDFLLSGFFLVTAFASQIQTLMMAPLPAAPI